MGVETTEITAATYVTDLLGNKDGNTVRIPAEKLAAQLSLDAVAVNKSTRAQLDADLDWSAGTRGAVWGDETEALRGVYVKAGAAGAGGWSRVGDLPMTALSAAQLASKADQAALDAAVTELRQRGGGIATRPGEAPDAWAIWPATGAGAPEAGTAIVPGSTAGITVSQRFERGRVLTISDRDVTVGPRATWPVQPEMVYRIDVWDARERNPADPEGDAVRIRLACLDADFGLVNTITLTAARLDVGPVRHLTATFAISTALGTPDRYLDPATVQLRPIIRTYGADHETDLIQVQIKDITEAAQIAGGLDVLALAAAREGAVAAATAAANDRTLAVAAQSAAAASAAEAALYDGRKVDTSADLPSVTPAMLPVGALIRVIETGIVYQRVNAGGELDYSASGGVMLNSIAFTDRAVSPMSQRRVRLFDILKSKVRPQWFTGYTSAWAGDCTAAMQAALQYAADENRTLVIEEPATVSELYLMPGQRVEFDGPRFAPEDSHGAGWRAARGANPASGYLVSLYHSGSPSDWHWRGVYLSNPVIYGDMGFQPHTFGLLSIDNTPSPDATVNPRHVVQGFFLREAPGTAFFIGPRTYDGRYQDGNIYKSRGFGLHYGGVDSQISNVNVARSYNHNVYIRGSELRLIGLKSWGAGDYYTNDPGLVPGVDPTQSCGIYSYRAEGVALIGAKTQESARNGLRIVDGGVGTEARDWDVVAYDSDGDCRATSGPAIHMERVLRSKFQCNVDRRNSGFLGTITRAVSAITSTTDCEFAVTYNPAVVTGYPIELTGSVDGNSWRLNNHDRKTMSAGVISSYTPNPVAAQRHRLTMGEANLTVQNPAAKPIGFRLEFEFIQTSAVPRTIAFGTDFKVPSGWAPSTTTGKRAAISFICDGTLWIPTGYVNEA